MLSYMEYIERQFLGQCGVGPHDSYANLLLTSDSIINFRIPQGQSIQLGSQANPNTFNTYRFSDLSNITGSLGFLYSSVPVPITPTRKAPLRLLCERFLTEYNSKDRSKAIPKATFLYGKTYLTGKSLEAMAIRKSNGKQLIAKWVCDPRLPKPVVLTTTFQKLTESSTTEFIYSTHENLLGLRGLYNVAEWDSNTKVCAGFEMFYAANKKAPGLSVGTRYSTSSKYTATPLILTSVLNPLMGNFSVAYALKPASQVALSSRFDFNFYSYDSDLSLGCEFWRNRPISQLVTQSSTSCFKISTSLASQSAKFLWETSFKDFLVSTGASLCYGDPTLPVDFGIELTYAS